MTPQAVIQAVGDEPERAYAAGENAVRHVVTEWATRALLAEQDRDGLADELVRMRRAFADVEAELADFRAVTRGRT